MSRTRQAGFTLIELLVVVGIVGVVSAMALPGLYRARQTGFEASAVGSLRTVNSAQVSYAAACAGGFYAPTLESLGTAPTAGGIAFLSDDLGGPDPVLKSGYRFEMKGTAAASAPPSCNGLSANSTLTGYAAMATPIPGGGWRYFATNTSNTIWQHEGDLSSVTETDPPSVGKVLQ